MAADNTRKPTPRSGSHFSSSSSTPSRLTKRPAASRGTIPPVTTPATPTAPTTGVPAGVSSDAPRPVLDPAKTGSFSTLRGGQGAVIPTRETAAIASEAARESLHSPAATGALRIDESHRPNTTRQPKQIKTDRRLFIGLGIAAVIIVVVIALLVRNAIMSTGDTGGTGQVEQTQVGVDQTISYSGYTYALSTNASGAHVLTRTAEGGAEPLVLAQFAGDPVSLVLYNGAFYVGENLGDSWDVMCCVMGDGSVPSQLVGPDGNPAGGSGSLVSSNLQGSTLVLTDDKGLATTVPIG